jgi:hypothetical protein
LTLEELQAELDKLPSQDPHYQIGFLMRRVVLLMNQLIIEEMNREETT